MSMSVSAGGKLTTYSFLSAILLGVVLIGSLASVLMGQTTVSQGSIQGTITDQTNAVVPDATITITSRTTGQVVTVKTSSAGAYNSGGLPVGEYRVKVQAKGFKTVQLNVQVQISVTSSGNVKLEIGQETTTVEVRLRPLPSTPNNRPCKGC